MQDRKRLSEGIVLVSPYDSIAHVCIETAGLCIIFIYVYFINAALPNGIIYEGFAITVSLFFGQDEQHFQHIAAQSHKTGVSSGWIARDKKLHSRQILLLHEGLEVGDVFFFQEMVRTAHRPFPHIEQFL